VLFDQALALSPDQAAIHYDRAASLWALERGIEAVAAYDAALAINPAYFEAHYNRAVSLQRMLRLEDALAGFEAALGINPRLAQGWNNRAGVLQEMGRDQEALDSIERALALRPKDAASHYNRGLLLLSLGRFSEAQQAFDLTLSLDPRHSAALGLLTSSALKACNWPRVAALKPRLLDEVAKRQAIVPPLTFITVSDDPALQRICAETHLARSLRETAVPTDPQPVWKGERYGHARIRIAYLSTDFRNHPVGAQIVELLEGHDRGRFEVIGVYLGYDDGSALHKRIIAACDQFHAVREMGDAEIAALLRRLEVDILIDLNGQTFGWRPGILKYRPAPVQAFYLGFAGTTGAPFIDYIIGDAGVTPFESRPHFSEHIVQLPHSFWPSAPLREALPAISRAEAGLPEQGFVFCCFNTHWKISLEMFQVWMRLLAAVPGSVLWLRKADDTITAALTREARMRGVDPARILWAGREDSFARHLARHVQADLFLDTFPYNAHVTASDALWAGLPLVTRRGNSFVSRVAASFLAALDLPELIASDIAAYEAAALALARDPARLKTVRNRLTRNRLTQPLFDVSRFIRGIEAAFARMHARAEQGEAPAAFAVPPMDAA
jgi:predicted O-linked N-acetylglucosamine transferase (SPINDLY family)